LDSIPTAETTRQFELEADAMAAYFLAHEQGRNFDVAELRQGARVAYYNADCDINDPYHWGTPKQNECATLWGADQGLDMTGDPVSPKAFHDLFLQNLDLILALDPSVCTLTDDSVVSQSKKSKKSKKSEKSEKHKGGKGSKRARENA
jgi:hypothetical protein